MTADERKPVEEPRKPVVDVKGAAPRPPAPPEKPKTPGKKDAKSKDEMPDLDQFNFMSW